MTFVYRLKYCFLFSIFASPVSYSIEGKDKEQQPAYFDHLDAERKSSFAPYIITPHKMTYFLPINYTDDINKVHIRTFAIIRTN
jgi:hypothetical protein